MEHTQRTAMEHTQRTEAGQRLLGAASELFYREGINAVGVAGIAEAAGVTKKTLYDCFGSKNGLVEAYLADRHSRWWAFLEQRVATAGPPRVLALFPAYLEHPAMEPSRGCGFLNGAAELPREHPAFAVIRRHKAAVRDRIVELLTEDLPALEDRQRDSLAAHLFLLLEGAVAQSGVDGHTGYVQEAQEIARSLLDANTGSD